MSIIKDCRPRIPVCVVIWPLINTLSPVLKKSRWVSCRLSTPESQLI